jgi:hypothetical protein
MFSEQNPFTLFFSGHVCVVDGVFAHHLPGLRDRLPEKRAATEQTYSYNYFKIHCVWI